MLPSGNERATNVFIPYPDLHTFNGTVTAHGEKADLEKVNDKPNPSTTQRDENSERAVARW